ncbi:DisA bacterial checkpoint controller nucleotide-binding protein [Phycisphaerae bacterium RAS1]|nr:DisA bacterial checkpoint controller nucleotide-binding protein [Phycisphaerae bacterium RAS1]
MLDTLLQFIDRLRSDAYDPRAVGVELLLIGLSVNWCMSVLRGTRGTRPLRGLLMVLIAITLVVRVLSAQMGWTRLELLYNYLIFGLAFIALVAFQPELRRAVIRAGDVSFSRRRSPQSRQINSLVKAAGHLTRNKCGALIAIQRDVDLRGWAENGTILNAELSPALLNAVFFPNSPLHDLGVIVSGNRVVAASCQFPTLESDEIDAALGSRHLAALGMSYETDALVLVVSEETGGISLADNGELHSNIPLERLPDDLSTRLHADVQVRVPRTLRTRLHQVRRAAIVAGLTGIIWYLADQASQISAGGVPMTLSITAPQPGLVVDVELPSQATVSVTLRGSTRAVEALRAAAQRTPLPAEWVLDDTRSKPGRYSVPAAELLERSAAVRARGVSIEKVLPDTVTFVVDEKAAVMMPVRVGSGRARVADVNVSPAEVRVSLRRRDLDRLAETDRAIELPLQDRLAAAEPGKTQTFERLALSPRINGVELLAVEPAEVSASLRVVGQSVTRRLSGITVRYDFSPRMLERYGVERRDPNEWLLEFDVEGERPLVESLRPQDVRALVPITRELEPPSTDFRTVEIEIILPPGVALVGPPRVVQLRLVALQAAPP